jgi:hypothetical protein
MRHVARSLGAMNSRFALRVPLTRVPVKAEWMSYQAAVPFFRLSPTPLHTFSRATWLNAS